MYTSVCWTHLQVHCLALACRTWCGCCSILAYNGGQKQGFVHKDLASSIQHNMCSSLKTLFKMFFFAQWATHENERVTVMQHSENHNNFMPRFFCSLSLTLTHTTNKLVHCWREHFFVYLPLLACLLMFNLLLRKLLLVVVGQTPHHWCHRGDTRYRHNNINFETWTSKG